MSLLSSSSSEGGGPQHKADVRARVWEQLRKVAYPDSRFHYDFSSFITDFQGSEDANRTLLAQPCFRDSACVFITPDNCLEYLREQALEAGIKVLTTTYGIRRGFKLLDPTLIDRSLYKYASTLDGMERVASPVSLADIVDRRLQVGLMVTGTGAINEQGIRFGKGHGFFDLEWAMLYSLGVVDTTTTTAAIVHDCQVLRGEQLVPEVYDTVCDMVVTPTTMFSRLDDGRGGAAAKPTCGILWDRLEPNMLHDIPPLQELKSRQASELTPPS